MLLQPAKEVGVTLKKLWVGSLLIWLGMFAVLWPGQTTLAYGSFLLWSSSSGFVWGRKAPFLTVVFFLVASRCLASDDVSLNDGLWVALVFTSSLCSTFRARDRLQGQALELREKAQAEVFLPVARLSSIGRMSSSLGHDMKNQIAVIIGYLEQLQDEKEISPSNRRKIERSLQAAEKMIQVLNHLRLLTRDSLKEPTRPVALNLTILDAVQLLERPLLFRSIAMDLQLAEALPPVRGDAVLLETLFIHLLQQSIEGQSRTITIRTQQESAGSLGFHYQDDALDQRPRSPVDRFMMEQLLVRIGGSWQENGRAWTIQLATCD